MGDQTCGLVLTRTQGVWLQERIKKIRQGLPVMRVVIETVVEINRSELWRYKYTSFKHFCEIELGLSDRTIRRWCKAQKLIEALPETTAPKQVLRMPDGTPLRQAHVIALKEVPDDKEDAVLELAIKKAEAKLDPEDKREPRLTTKIIREAAAEVVHDSAQESSDVIDKMAADLPLFQNLIRDLRACNQQTKSLGRGVSGKWLDVPNISALIEQVITEIRYRTPHSTCVYCGGQLDDREDCNGCDGLGVSCRMEYEQASDIQKQGVILLKDIPQ